MFGEIRSDEKELFTKFKIDKTPTILSLTNAAEYEGDRYNTTEIKIDQLKKFLGSVAYKEIKIEKKLKEFEELNLEKV